MNRVPILAMTSPLLVGVTACQPPVEPWRVYVTNERDGTLSVIDEPSHRVVKTIPLGKRPRGAFLTANGKTLFVALSGSPVAPPGVDEATLPPPDKGADGIGIVDTRWLKLVRTLRGISDPERVAGTPDGAKLYVASEDAGSLVEIDTRSGARRTVAVGDQPEGVTLSPDGTTVFVGSEGDGRVTAIDVRSFKPVGTMAIAGRPRTIAINRAGQGFVAAEDGGAVVAFDATTRKTVGVVRLPGNGVRPMGIATAGKQVFVTTGRGGTLVRVGAATLRVSGAVAVGKRPWGVAISPDGGSVYTANGPSGDVSIVDAAHMTVRATVKAGSGPWDVVSGRAPSSTVQR